ncbi:MAG: molybdenum cofactor guanylyltransferase [Gammaproteobacteria bacterium]|nr:MAG: molybdenum cofactor guanylyltransferase [Gammaproteobacteria bacterium]
MTETVKGITGVILVGGKGKRFGGQDKGLITVSGKPLVEHAIALLAKQVDNILVNANRSEQQYATYGYPVISDAVGEYWGPLAGVVSCMEAASDPYILTIPCDSPCLPDNLAVRLLEKIEQESADICVAHDGQRLQPAIALYRTKLQPELLAALNAGERKVEHWITNSNHTTADFSDQTDAFFNINTPADKQTFELQRINP